MYCVRCGAELASSEKSCPLCRTVVYHPDISPDDAEPLFPAAKFPAPKRKGFFLQAVLTVLFLLPMLIVLLCDLQFCGRVTWSGYVIGALAVGYIIILPVWFRRPNPVIFVPCSFAAALLYLLYIDLVSGGNWFLPLAFPVGGAAMLIVTAVVTLLHYLKGGRLYIFGGAAIAMGLLALLIEFLVNAAFDAARFVGWSLYPLVTLSLLGLFLIFLAICRPARQLMERQFFI